MTLVSSLKRLLTRLVLGAFGLIAGCSRGACPTIACAPKIELAYQNSIANTYNLSVQVAGVTLQSNCPMQATPGPYNAPPTIQSCDSNGLVVSGVDLGHGSNETVAVAVKIDDGSSIPTTATLQGITNSRDCDFVCYVHTGVVSN